MPKLARVVRNALPEQQAVDDALEILLPPTAGEGGLAHGFGVGRKLGERSLAVMQAEMSPSMLFLYSTGSVHSPPLPPPVDFFTFSSLTSSLGI